MTPEDRAWVDKMAMEADIDAEIPVAEPPDRNRRLVVDLPEDHFITTYTEWMATVIDGYPEYAIAGGLWLLSAFCNRNVVLKLRQEHIHPNLWIVNLGKSTTARKSTSINKTRKIFEAVAEVTLSNDDYSIEGYLETLAQNHVLNNVRDEVGGLMAKFHKKYNEGIFDLECSIYDCENVSKTLAGGKNKEPKTFVVKNPRVTKLYATTPANYSRYMTMDDFASGYGMRFLYVYPQYKHKRMALALETEEDVHKWADVVMKSKQLFKRFDNYLEVNMIATDEAMAYYDEQCMALEDRADESGNGMIGSVIGRSEIHILKIAMLLEIGKAELSTTIGIDMMKVACDMVTQYFVPCIMDVMDEVDAWDAFSIVQNVVGKLRQLGGTARHSDLLRRTHLTSKEFRDAINTLVESQSIKTISSSNGGNIYTLLNNGDKFRVPNPR